MNLGFTGIPQCFFNTFPGLTRDEIQPAAAGMTHRWPRSWRWNCWCFLLFTMVRGPVVYVYGCVMMCVYMLYIYIYIYCIESKSLHTSTSIYIYMYIFRNAYIYRQYTVVHTRIYIYYTYTVYIYIYIHIPYPGLFGSPLVEVSLYI